MGVRYPFVYNQNQNCCSSCRRDAKPELDTDDSILLDDDMRIKITDFGSAKILTRDEEVIGEFLDLHSTADGKY